MFSMLASFQRGLGMPSNFRWIVRRESYHVELFNSFRKISGSVISSPVRAYSCSKLNSTCESVFNKFNGRNERGKFLRSKNNHLGIRLCSGSGDRKIRINSNIKSSTTVPSHAKWNENDDPTALKLLSATTLQGAIKVVEENTEKMEISTIPVALNVLFNFIKSESLSAEDKQDVLNTVGVQKLLKSISRSGPSMEPRHLINGVKLLSFLSAPGNHPTFQVLLKLISKQANDLELHNIIYLQFLLDKLDSISHSHLSKALQVALPVVFEAQLETQLKHHDAQSICDCLHYAAKYKLSDKTVNNLVNAALKITDRIPPRLSMSLLWSLCDSHNDNPSHEPLVQWCFRKLTDSIETFKLGELSTVQSKCIRKYTKRVEFFYNEDFVDAYCRLCLKKGVDKYTTLWAISYLSFFKHVNIELVDKVGDLIASNPSLVLNDNNLFITLVKGLSSFNYKPEKWSKFSSILLEHPALTKTYGRQEVTLAVDFLALGLFPETMIRVLFSADGLPLLEECQERFGVHTLVLLYNAVNLFHPQYKGPLPPTSMIESWKKRSRASNTDKKYPLKQPLGFGLGGESYIINGVYHDGLHIDHGIILKKGDFPVPLYSENDSQTDVLNEIAMPPEAVLILIKVIPNDSYTNNTRRLRGVPALELKIIEKLGHPVIAVDLKKWTELLEHERVPFLMQKINEKMESLEWNQNSGDTMIPP